MGSTSRPKVAPDTHSGIICMTRKAILSIAALLALPTAVFAQKDKEKQIVFETSEVHKTAPELRVFVTPMVADLEMIDPTKGREEYECTFQIKSIDTLTEIELINLQNRTMYRFAQEHNADVIVEPIFNTRVMENDSKSMIITITGYPAKYVNFRKMDRNSDDFEMVRIVYPAEFQTIKK